MERQNTMASANWSVTRGFLENLAHDLRQPLGDIEMIAYHLQTCATLEPGQAREMLAKIRRLVAQTDEILCGSLQAVEDPSADFAATQRPLTGVPIPPAGA
jgi:signal transduction histidine kinase